MQDELCKIIRIFIDKNVIKHYTPRVKKRDKDVFNKTIFYEIIRERFKSDYDTLKIQFDESLFLSALGNIFLNSKAWDGGRKERNKSSDEHPLNDNKEN